MEVSIPGLEVFLFSIIPHAAHFPRVDISFSLVSRGLAPHTLPFSQPYPRWVLAWLERGDYLARVTLL